MPSLRPQLGTRDINTDRRRLNTGTGDGGGSSVKNHQLLGPKHSDAEEGHASEGSLILGNSDANWEELIHPDAAGYAFITDATTWTIDLTPTWQGRHTWNDGTTSWAYIDEDGESVFRRTRTELQASHFSMGESHGIGGTAHVAPCASLRSAVTIS